MLCIRTVELLPTSLLTSVEIYAIILSNPSGVFLMPVTYSRSKTKYRITLELDVQEDFVPQNIDWNKVLDIQGSEKVTSYVEDLSTPDFW